MMRINIDTGIKSGGIKRYDNVKIADIGYDTNKTSSSSANNYEEIDYSKSSVPDYADIEAQTAELDKEYRDRQESAAPVSNVVKVDVPTYEEVAAETAKMDAEYRETNNTGKSVSIANDTAASAVPTYEEVAVETAKMDAEYKETNNTGKLVSNPLKSKQLDYGKVISELEKEKNDTLNSNNMTNINVTTNSYIPDYDRVAAQLALQEQKLKERNNTYVETSSNRTYRDIANEIDAIADRMENGATPEEMVILEKKLVALQHELERVGVDDYGQLAKEGGATIANATLSYVKGIGSFFESLFDSQIIYDTLGATVVTGKYDIYRGILTGNWNFEATNALWDKSMPAVSYEIVDTFDKQLGLRQDLDRWSLISSDSADAKMFEDLGYATGIVATNGFFGSGGTLSAMLYAGSAGMGRKTAAAKRDGATNLEALADGILSGTYEGLEYGIGYKINTLKIVKGAGVVPRILNSLLHVFLDSVDAGVSIPVEAKIKSAVYGGDWGEEIERLGGLEGILKRFETGAIFSFATEIPDIFAAVSTAKTLDNVGMYGINDEFIDKIQGLRGKKLISLVEQADELGKLEVVANSLSTNQLMELDLSTLKSVIYNLSADEVKALYIEGKLFSTETGKKLLEDNELVNRLLDDKTIKFLEILNSDDLSFYDDPSFYAMLKDLDEYSITKMLPFIKDPREFYNHLVNYPKLREALSLPSCATDDLELVKAWSNGTLPSYMSNISDEEVEKIIKKLYYSSELNSSEKSYLLDTVKKICNSRSSKIANKFVEKSTYDNVLVATYGENIDVLESRSNALAAVLDKITAGGDSLAAEARAKLLSFTKRINIYDCKNPDDLYWQLVYDNQYHVSVASAGYDTINIFSSVNIDTLAHEGAHNFDRFLSGTRNGFWSNSGVWKEACDADFAITSKISPTNYGTNDLQEDFAESMMLFLDDVDSFMEEFPNRGQVLIELYTKYLLK